MELLQNAWQQLSHFDRFVIAANMLLVVFSAPLARMVTGSDSETQRRRILVLRALSSALLVLYLIPLFLGPGAMGTCEGDGECNPLRRLSLTGLTLLLSYLLYIIGHAWLIRRYGRRREIEGVMVQSQTYHSELFSLLFLLGLFVVAFLFVLSIWDVEDWLRGTSVLGALLLTLFFTKDVWLPDTINALILLYNKDVEPGAVVRIASLNLLGVALRTTLIQTEFRDLVQGHLVIVPNSKLRTEKIELLSKGRNDTLRDNVDFNIGYEVGLEEVKSLLMDAWRAACKAESALCDDVEPRVFVVDNGDHAVRYRLLFNVGNCYRLMPARFAIMGAALEKSKELGVGLNTPLTHTAI